MSILLTDYHDDNNNIRSDRSQARLIDHSLLTTIANSELQQMISNDSSDLAQDVSDSKKP